MFFAENKNGRCEIVDGSQRVRTFYAFINNDLVLEGLTRLDKLNGYSFADLPESRKKKIRNTALRLIFLSENATEEVKNDLFERINRGSDLLKDMEKRKGIYRGEFTDFIYNNCANNQTFQTLAPISSWLVKRQEREELILRFFALLDLFPDYKTEKIGVAKILDEYLEEKNRNFTEEEQSEKSHIFQRVSPN